MHVPPALFSSLVLLLATAKKRSLGRLAEVAGTWQTLSNLFWRLLISMVSTVALFKVAYFVMEVNETFNFKMSSSKLVKEVGGQPYWAFPFSKGSVETAQPNTGFIKWALLICPVLRRNTRVVQIGRTRLKTTICFRPMIASLWYLKFGKCATYLMQSFFSFFRKRRSQHADVNVVTDAQAE